MITLEIPFLLNNLSHCGGPEVAIAKDMSFLCGLDIEGISDDQIENRLADIGQAMQGLYDGETFWLTLEGRQTRPKLLLHKAALSDKLDVLLVDP